MRTMSHPVTKKRIFWVREMERFGLGAGDSVFESSGSTAIRKQGTITEVVLASARAFIAEVAEDSQSTLRK